MVSQGSQGGYPDLVALSFRNYTVFDLLVHMNVLGIVICPQTPSGNSNTSTLPTKVAEVSLREIRVMVVVAVLS